MTIRLIAPKGINPKEHEIAIRAALLAGARKANDLFYQSYHTWNQENQPLFKTINPKIIEHAFDI